MKNLTLLLCIFFYSTQAQAQRSQAIYVELGGAGLVYTLNYDTRFSDTEDKLGARIGISVLPDAIIVPLQMNYLHGTGKHKLEVGAGFTTIFGDIQTETETDVVASAALMYRFQKKEGHFLFRVGISPTFSLQDETDSLSGLEEVFWFWPGISFGYKF